MSFSQRHPAIHTSTNRDSFSSNILVFPTQHLCRPRTLIRFPFHFYLDIPPQLFSIFGPSHKIISKLARLIFQLVLFVLFPSALLYSRRYPIVFPNHVEHLTPKIETHTSFKKQPIKHATM